MSLSEQDLLLLDCFMYSDLVTKSGKDKSMSDIIEQFVDPKTGKVSKTLIEKSGMKFSGDMNASAFQDVLEDMRKSESIMNLKLMKTTPEYEGSIRAACFVDADTGKATVAFRGTGGSYQQWYNNFEGYGELSQETQDAAAEFINSLPYNDIDVTGHSNGGDQAMFVAIVCGDKVSRCISYEGQGLSKEFVNEYADEIEMHKGKIKNICGEKDFVSPLLIDIAGETVYVPSDSNLLDGNFDHGAYGLYIANRKVLENNNGNFPESAYVDQVWYCAAIHSVTVYLSEHSDTLFVGPALELFADFAGIIVGLAISGDWKKPEILLKAGEDLIIAIKDFAIGEIESCIAAIKEICKNVIDCIKKLTDLSSVFNNMSSQIFVNTNSLRAYASRLSTVNTRISNLDRRLDGLYWKVGLLGLWDLIQADALTGYSWRLNRCVSYLNNTATNFEKVEDKLNV